jgi:hypothetical protein
MSTINIVKELAEADSPLLLFECLLPNGSYQWFSTHAITFNNQAYSARVLTHNLFDFQLSADDAMESVAQVSLTLANADSLLSEIDVEVGWKGTQLTVYFVFADLTAGTPTTESTIVFRGVAGDPDETTEETLQLTFSNRLSLMRVGLPTTRIQRLCPWSFPASPQQRSEAINGDRFSRFRSCGYSADIGGGLGNLTVGQAFATCDHTRANCVERGMFSSDSNGKTTSRFGGLEFVPSSILVRGFGEKTASASKVIENVAKYNDFVPMVYGTGWLNAPVVFARNDGNLTHIEVLLGAGPIDQVLKVVVSGIEIPQGVAGKDMTTTGWYNIVSMGAIQGAFNLDFTDDNKQPLGDPHGSMAVLSVVVPNRINSGGSLPHVEVLLQGLHLDRYNLDGSFRDNTFTNNPAWIILDILRRAGWSLTDLNLSSFANAAVYCDELIQTTDLNGKAIQVPRYHANLILTKRKTAAEIVRGIRVACGLMLRYGVSGLLELLPETTLALQQPALPDGSAASQPLAGGWPAYEFGDGSNGASGIARDTHGRSTLRIMSRGLAELSNRLSVEFQDEANEYQQDSLSLANDQDQALIGYELGSTSTALGIPNFNQAFRVLSRQLAKGLEGNQFIQFETSFRAMKLRPGDIIALSYLREGFNRTPFRVTKLTPSLNFRRVQILAQYHDDNWYSDNPGTGGGMGRQPGAGVSLPRPLLGTSFGANGFTQFDIQEQSTAQTDGSASTKLRVKFAQPTKPALSGPNLPLLSLSPLISTTGGTLRGGNQYYAVSANDAAGNEGMLSFVVAAAIPNTTSTNSVTLVKLSFPLSAASFNVYRGDSPQLLYRIASSQPLSDSFVDQGLAAQPAGPADPNFDHANFYYRQEFAGPIIADIFSSTTIGSSDLNATPSVYSGMLVRLIEGTGIGQERRIVGNTSTTLAVSPAWTLTPENSTTFVITESAWRYGAVTSTSPVEFEVPNQMGTVVQVTGRGANVRDQEGTAELCPITRWVVGGSSGSQLDLDVPPVPTYVLSVAGQGNLTLSQVGFGTLTNTRSVTAGALQLMYFDELQMPSGYFLSGTIDTTATALVLNAGITGQNVVALQVGSETMAVTNFDAPTNTCTVVRGQFGTTAAAHNAGDPVLLLQQRIFVVPFARDFFENPASQNYAHTISLPDARVVASQFLVTNSRGNSQSTSQNYLGAGNNGGLRTCSGGQLAIQVGGYLAIQKNAAPPLLMEASHAARDVRASVTEPPRSGAITLMLSLGNTSIPLTIPTGQNTSNIVDGTSLPTFREGSTISLDVTGVGKDAPGRDLTVTIRF